LIKINPNRKILCQFVSSQLLKQQFSFQKSEEIDKELLEALKMRLFWEIDDKVIISNQKDMNK
jgi:hypothetical protein